MLSSDFSIRSLWTVILMALLSACGGSPATTAEAPTTTVPSATVRPSETPTPTPEPTATATPSCQTNEGELRQSNYASRQAAEPVPLWLYLPPCYPLPADQLPIVFFFHGKPFDQEHWVDLGLIQVYQQGLMEDRWQRALLVLPKLPEPLFSQSDGGPGSYEQEFLDAVLPAVESEYEALGEDRHLAGISRGGIWALEIGMNNPDGFNKVAALSPSLAVNYPRPQYDPFQLARSQQEYPEQMMLLAGEGDWARPDTEELALLLADQGANIELRIVPGEHQDPTWEAALPLVLDFLLPPLE